MSNSNTRNTETQNQKACGRTRSGRMYNYNWTAAPEEMDSIEVPRSVDDNASGRSSNAGGTSPDTYFSCPSGNNKDDTHELLNDDDSGEEEMADEDDDMCSLQSDGNSTPRAITPAPPSNEPPEIQVIGVYSRKPGENDLIDDEQDDEDYSQIVAGASTFSNSTRKKPRGSSMFEPGQVGCKIVEADDVLADLERLVAETELIAGLPASVCFTLLAENKWSKEMVLEKIYSGPGIAPEMYGAFDPETLERRAIIEADCEICYERDQSFALNCGHFFCFHCWDRYLFQKIRNESVLSVLCPMRDCKVIVDPKSVEQLKDDTVFVNKFYKNLQVKYYVQSSRLMRFCPGENCEKMVRAPSLGCWPVDCDCGSVYCFGCAEQWHEPINCDLLKLWIKQCTDDGETYNWIDAYTKDCPKCKTAIEKNGGCNHMTCRASNCRFEFCWVCLGDWHAHQNNYQCNRFEGRADDSIEKEKKKEQSREALQRYLHYYNRFRNHQKSSELEHKLYRRIADIMEVFQTEQKVSYIETTFLENAVNRLCEARRTLMYTYSFAFYLKRDANMTQIFESNQSDLELATERLSELLEQGDLDELVAKDFKKLRLEIQNKVGYMESRRNTLLKHCVDGAQKGEWNYNRPEIKVGTICYGVACT